MKDMDLEGVKGSKNGMTRMLVICPLLIGAVEEDFGGEEGNEKVLSGQERPVVCSTEVNDFRGNEQKVIE